jgi:hypothetical protein
VYTVSLLLLLLLLLGQAVCVGCLEDEQSLLQPQLARVP